MTRSTGLSTGFGRYGAGCSLIAIPGSAGPRSGGFLLGTYQFAIDPAFGNLNRVQRRTLAQILRDAPQPQTIVHRGLAAHAPDIGGILARRLVRRDIPAWLALAY